MRNLLGLKDADAHIQEELILAGIPIYRNTQSRTELPSNITGWFKGWLFERAPEYWVASAQPKKGLILEYAHMLHNKKYPIVGEKLPEVYGEVVRVNGNCTCPQPKNAADNYDSLDRLIVLDTDCRNEKSLRQLVEAGRIPAERLDSRLYVQTPEELQRRTAISMINMYHVDTQLGLNELVNAIKGNVRY